MGNRVSLAVDAPADVSVNREEVEAAIERGRDGAPSKFLLDEDSDNVGL